MKNKKYLYGASGHAKVVLDNLFSNDNTVEGIIDDNPTVEKILGLPVHHSKKFDFSEDQQFIITIGNNAIRKKIVTQHNFTFFKAIHKDATVSKSACVGVGTVIMPRAVVNADAKIGKHCIVNSGGVVEHDCVLEDYVHISPNAALAGNVTVGEGTHIGIGATVIQGVTIGKWAIVGAGTVVIKDIPDYAVVVGNPAKIIKTNK